MNSRAKIGLVWAFCTSLGLHGGAYASLATEAQRPKRSTLVSEVNFELPPVPTELREPEPASATEPRAANARAAARQPAPQNRPSPVAAAPVPTTERATPDDALDLSGVTLTNDSGSGFAMPVGDGSAQHGPIGVSASGNSVGAARTAVENNVPRKPPLVAVGDLSERPKPPSLSALLRANYPEEARLRGLRGEASLRARIEADGVIRIARVLSESSNGFGAACRRAVLGSRWSAPHDKNGDAVATEIVYTCHFEIDQ